MSSTTTNNNYMETPPASPPRMFSKGSGGDVGNNTPDLGNTISLSQESGIMTLATDSPSPMQSIGTTSSAEGEKRGHIRMATPSTPIPVAEAFAQAAPGSSTTTSGSLRFTPGRGGYHHGVGQQHHLMSELTPVISNSNNNAMYVDNNYRHVRNSSQDSSDRPRMPGLAEGGATTAAERGGGEFMVVSPPTSGATTRTRMPLPRAGLPPAKLGNFENINNPVAASSVAATMASRGRQMITSAGASSAIPLRVGRHMKTSPNNTDSCLSSEAKDGLGGLLIGERLAMPSYGSLHSEDDSISSSSNSGGGVGRRHRINATSIFKQKEQQQRGQQKQPLGVPTNLAPIELKPDRKFFSFQGTSQYKNVVEDSTAPQSSSRLDTISGSPYRGPLLSPALDSQGQQHQLPMVVASHQNQQQYQPTFRSQHGVTELANSKDLNAIFKAPRAPHSTNAATLVTPQKQPSPASMAVDDETAGGGGDPMVTGPSVLFGDEYSGDCNLRGEEKFFNREPSTKIDCEDSRDLKADYPVDDRQWSIPSIRLANHVNLSSNNLLSYNHYGSQLSLDEYTDDDESYYSFLGDDDDASLSSRGSIDVSIRRRRLIRASMELSNVAAANIPRLSDHLTPPTTSSLDNSASGSSHQAQPPAIGQTNSFLEGIQGISIENATKGTTPFPQRANTFDSEIMMVDDDNDDNSGTNALPPILNVNTAMDDADYHQSRRWRRHRGQHSSRRRKEGSAMGWIHDLQSQTKNQDVQLIAESASSKFMTTTTPGGSDKANVGVTSDKALGLPHPLCRSSTIEAVGPFTIHRGGFRASGSGDIALTSSGSD